MSELLSRARNAEDLDCPRRDFGPICQGKLIRELADEIERLRFAAKNAVWDLLRENHVSYAEKGVVDTIRRLIEAWHEGQDEVKRLRNDVSHQVSQQWRTKCLVAEKFNKELAERVDLLEAIRAAQGETIKDLRAQLARAQEVVTNYREALDAIADWTGEVKDE